MSVRITETINFDLTEANISASTHEIRNVAILNPISKNGRKYLQPAMDDVVGLINRSGAKSFLDHSEMPCRPVRELLGRVSNAERKYMRVFATLVVLRHNCVFR